MLTFFDWLEFTLSEARRPEIEPGVLAGYEAAFRDQLRAVIMRTRDPTLRDTFERMLNCPVRDQQGHCRQFAEYILAALLRNGVHRRYDLEAALSYVAERMLMTTGMGGKHREAVFGTFVEKPGQDQGFNPLQARFMTALRFYLTNILKGSIPRLADSGSWPPGTARIETGRRRDGDPAGGVSADSLPARQSSDADLAEMLADIESLLRRRERVAGLPLVAVFDAMLAGTTVHAMRREFGDRVVGPSRQAIIKVIEEYAQSSGNFMLLNLVRQLHNGDSDRGDGPTTSPSAKRAVLSDQERDYASLAAVVARFARPVGSAEFGKYRRRWLEYPPRSSPEYRNRLEEVLAAMVRDSVLKAERTKAGAVVYSPGPEFERYAPAGVTRR